MAYITNYKKKLVLDAIRITEMKKFKDRSLIFGFEKCEIFSSYEMQEMLTAKNIFLDWKELLRMNNYPVERFISTFKSREERNYLYSSKYHVYHKDSQCEKLNKIFKNLGLDRKIVGEKEIEYKEWLKKKLNENWKENIKLLESRVFKNEHIKNWGEEIDFPEYVEKKNSGIYSLEKNQLEDRIKEKKKELIDYFKNIEKSERENLRGLLKYSYLVEKNKKESITNENIKKYYKELEIISKIKKDMIELIKLYYINTSEVNQELIEKLNFKKCSCCM